MATQNTNTESRKEQVQKQRKILKNQMRRRMDDLVWSKLDPVVEKVKGTYSFYKEHRTHDIEAIGSWFLMMAVLNLFEPVGQNTVSFALGFATLIVLLTNLNKDGMQIFGDKVIEVSVSAWRKVGSSFHTLASSVGKRLPAPQIGLMKWFSRLINFAVLGAASYQSYKLYPYTSEMVAAAASNLTYPSVMTETYSILLASMPITLGLMMLYLLNRLTLTGWRIRKYKFGAAMLLGIVQFLAVFQIISAGLLS